MSEEKKKTEGWWTTLQRWRKERQKSDNIVTLTSPELGPKLKRISDSVDKKYRSNP